jgi:hypothetical protein
LPANSCIFVGKEDPAFAGAQALSAPNCCACNSAAAGGIESRPLRPLSAHRQLPSDPTKVRLPNRLPTLDLATRRAPRYP